MSRTSETERVNRIWDKVAPVYDKRIGFFGIEELERLKWGIVERVVATKPR